MDPTRWKRIEAIYQSALEQPTEERPVFLRGACEGDEGLLREVEEMLEARGQAGSFLVEPAAEQMGLVQDGKANRNLIGTRLGAYEVLSPWARVEWERFTGLGTRGSTGSTRSRFSLPNWLWILTACAASSGKPGPPRP